MYIRSMEYSVWIRQEIIRKIQKKKFKNGNTINSLWKTELSGDRQLRLKDGARMTIQMLIGGGGEKEEGPKNREIRYE